MPIKRFMLFAYDAFYPSGGWSDFHGSFDTLDEAVAAWVALHQERLLDYYQIVDLHTGEEIEVSN